MWGISAEGISARGEALELLYQYQSTTIPVYGYSGSGSPIVNPLNGTDNSGVISYLLINGIQYFQVNPKITPYFGAGGGVAFTKVNSGNGSTTGFGWDLKTGVKIKAGKSLGFKIGAQLFSALHQSGGYYYYPGYPYSYSSFASIWQFSFTGGVTYDFGGH
jgi:opacity protein-like surface antigen